MPLALTVDAGVAIDARRLRREVARMVKAAACHAGRDDFDVALRLVGDVAIRALNREWRGKDKPTDVLAFPQAASPHADLLGDIVISVDTARRQAKRGLH